jgi:hypothetical protein
VTALLLCLLAVTAKGIGDRPVILDGATDPYASEFVFFGTGYGIYTYNRASGTWARITTANGLPDNRATVLALDDGILWVATAAGLASADVRINDWQTYTLPGEIRALAFDDKYVWAGGDSGLRRFDKYAETWNIRGDVAVNDLFAEKGLLWIATDAGVQRCDARFDRIDEMPAPPDTYVRIINTPGRVWFADRHHLAAFNKSTESWSGYGALEIDDYATLGDSIVVASRGKGFIYEPGADHWAEIHEAEEIPRINGLFAGSDELLLATSQGLLVYNQKENSKKTWNRNNGLINDTLTRAYADQQLTYVVSAGAIQFLNRQSGTWQHEDLVPAGAKKERIAYLDDAGAHLALVKSTDIRLAGRASYSDSRSFSAGKPTRTSYENIGLNLAAQHRTGRSLSLYYDDSDPDQVAYGLGYRGIGNDLLHRLNAGRLETEYADFDIVPRFSTLGGNVRLKHDAHTLDLQAGRLQSSLHSEFFTGRSVDKQVRLRDIDYAKGIFFRVSLLPEAAHDTVFVDDRNPATNTVRTREGYAIGGYTGDFDPLVRGTDYNPDYGAGVIHFVSPRKTGELVLLATDGGVRVIQTESDTTNRLRNTYLLGQDITPGTLKLEITDTSGANHPLAEFGIDNDGDGNVDPEYINHRLGLLRFPQPLTPEPQNPGTPSFFLLTASFQSHSVFYSIQHKPIIKNSETVTVDAEPMTRGADYVVDYTSGILLFLRKDVISDFSQIDIQYSSFTPEPLNPGTPSPFLLSAQPSFTILNSPLSILLSPGFSHVEDENMVHLSGRAEAGAGTNRGLRFVPQVAVNADRALAHDYSLSANYGIASAAARYQGFSDGFNDFGAADRRYGPLRHSAAVSAGVEPLKALRLDGTYRRDYLEDTLSANSSLLTANYASGKLSYLNPKYPNGYVLVGQDRLPDNDKLRLKANAGYEFVALKSKLKLNAIVQNTTLDHLTTGPLDHSLEYIAEATFSLPFPVNGSARFRQNDRSGSARSREREVKGRLGVDVIPGLYYTGSYNLQTNTTRAAAQDLLLESYLYNNLQLAPGRWWSRLSVVNLSFGTGSNFNEYVRNLDNEFSPPVLMLEPLDDVPISSADNLKSLYGTIQLQPVATLTLRAKRSLNRSGTAYYGLPDLRLTTEDEVKVEYEPGKLGLFTALWNRRVAAALPNTTRRNVYLEWNMPWSQLLRTRLTSGYTTNQDRYGSDGSALSRLLKGNVQTQFNFSSRSYATVDFGASRQQSDSTFSGSSLLSSHSSISLLPGAGFSLNLFRFLYLQLNCQSNFVLSGTATHTVSSRITGQF